MNRNRVMTHSLAALAFSIALSIVPTNHLHAQTAAPSTQADSKLVQLTLVGKLDSKSAKVGDPVIAKTVDKTELNGIAIPDGTKLLGKITAAAHSPASISVEFDSLEKKGQTSIPVQGILVAVGPPAESDTAPSLPGRGGYVSPNPTSRSDSSDSANALTSPGSSIKNLTLTSGTLSSNKDFKLSGGSRMAVSLSSVSK